MLKKNPTKYVPALDGLRGLAILMVICYHYFPGIRLFSIGWAGVDLFFVLSGYLITGRLQATLDSKHYFENFIKNRILRVFPLYYAVLIIFFIAVYIHAKDGNSSASTFYSSHWVSFFIFTENWSFIFYGLPDDSYLNHFWSLAIEEQFYFFWPWVIYFISPVRRRLMVICLFILGIVITRTYLYEFSSLEFNYYFNTFCRTDSLLIGAVLSQLYSENLKIPGRFVNILFAILFFIIITGIYVMKSAGLFSPFMATAGYTCLAFWYACILYMILEEYSLVKSFFSIPILRYTGKISFGLYVFHWPVLLILRNKATIWGSSHFQFSKSTLSMTSTGISILITFTLSALSYRYFESRFLKYKT